MTRAFYYLFFFIFFSTSVSGQRITFSKKSATIKQLFREITKQTGYGFFYEDVKIDQKRQFDANFKEQSVEEVLDFVFKDQPVSYVVKNESVLLRKKENLIVDEQADLIYRDINGRVQDEQGNFLSGASIKLKNGRQQTLSDQNGGFSLRKVRKNDILLISYVGFLTKEIYADSPSDVFILKSSDSKLDEIQIVAYGKNTKRYDAGNVSVINADLIRKQPIANVLQSLEGQVPGLIVRQSSGFSSSSLDVSVRGNNNLKRFTGFGDNYGTIPFYVIDGVPAVMGNGDVYNRGINQNGITGPLNGQSPLYGINPADVESISILKDADATAIYGAQAANGAILITTKSGKPGKTSFEVRANTGVNFQAKKLKLMDTRQYIQMREQAFNNDGIPQSDVNAYDLRIWNRDQYTDWQKELLGPGFTGDAQIGVSGGQKQLIYRLNSSFHKETFPGINRSAEQRSTFSWSINHRKPGKKFDFIMKGNYAWTKSDLPAADPVKLIYLAPNAPNILDRDQNLNIEGWKPVAFPSALRMIKNKYSATGGFLNASADLNYHLLSNLSFSALFGYNLIAQNQNLDLEQTENLLSELPLMGRNHSVTWLIEPKTSYKAYFEKGRLEVLLGGSLMSSTQYGLINDPATFPVDGIIDFSTLATNNLFLNSYAQNRFQSLYARLIYLHDKKYVLNINGRIDGSSRHGENHQVGSFGSIAAAWILSEEVFFKEFCDFFSFVKLRGSYGRTGGSGIEDDLSHASLVRGTYPYSGGISVFRLGLENPDLSPTINKKMELGLNIGLLNDHIIFAMSLFRNRSGNQVVNKVLPAMTGNEFVVANVPAVVENKGFEFNLEGTFFRKRNFNWTAALNVNIARNQLLDFPELNISGYQTTYAIGKSINNIPLLHYLGKNGSGRYEFEQNSATQSPVYLLKSTDPVFNGALQNSFSYDRFSLSFLITFYSQKGLLRPSNGVAGSLADGLGNQPLFLKDNFTTNQLRKDIFDYYYSDAYWVNASFIRLQNIFLEYKIPVGRIRGLKRSACSFFVQGQNLFTITGYKGLDPSKITRKPFFPLRSAITSGLQLTF